MEISTTVGLSMQTHREQRGLSRAQLARLAGVDTATVYRIETGRMTSPGLGIIAALARALGVSLDALLLGESR